MDSKLTQAKIDELIASGDLTVEQIGEIGTMLERGDSTQEIVASIMEENYSPASVTAIALTRWGLLVAAMGILFVSLLILNALTGKKKDKE